MMAGFVPMNVLAIWFIAPGFALAGLSLAALPIIIHFLNRRRFKTTPWAAMDFLLRAMKKNRRRLQFERWLLLATRCAVVILLGLGLARPLACQNGALAGLGRQTSLEVVVIDNSYSMAYEANQAGAKTHLDHAKLIAKKILSRPELEGSSAEVILAGRPAKSLFATPTYDLNSAAMAIDRIEQSAQSSDLVGALQAAMTVAKSHPEQPVRNLYILTAATRGILEGPSASALKAIAAQLASVYHVYFYNIAQGQHQWNSAITELSPATNLVVDKFPGDFKATIRTWGLSKDAQLQWRIDDQSLGETQSVHLDPKTQVNQPHAAFATGGPHVVSLRLMDDDRLPVDNQYQHVIDVASELKVLIVETRHGAGAMEGSGAFLKLALAPTIDEKGDTDSYFAPELISDLELNNKVLNEYQAIALAGIGQITDSEADRLKDFVEHGGTLMLFMGDAVDKDNYNRTLLPRKLLPGPLVKLVSVGADQRGMLFDFKPNGVVSRFLNEFARQPESGLESAQVFNYWQLELPSGSNAETVLSYLPPAGSPPQTPEAPAITYSPVGQGHVVFISTTANPDWTNLPAKLAYVPLMHELLSGSVRSGDYWMNLNIGQRLVLPASLSLPVPPSLLDPSRRVVLLADPDPNAVEEWQRTYHSAPLERPGVYTLNIANRQIPIAVNISAEENGDVFVLDDAAIHKAMGDIRLDLRNDQPESVVSSDEAHNDLGWWCLFLLLLAVGFEAFVAMKFGHYRRTSSRSGVPA